MGRPEFFALVLGTLLWASATAMAAEPVVRISNWFDYIGPDSLKGFIAETGSRPKYDVHPSNEVLEAKLI
ncbi:spermidine/putrescine-binding protein [Pseudomonas sp. TE3786]